MMDECNESWGLHRDPTYVMPYLDASAKLTTMERNERKEALRRLGRSKIQLQALRLQQQRLTQGQSIPVYSNCDDIATRLETKGLSLDAVSSDSYSSVYALQLLYGSRSLTVTIPVTEFLGVPKAYYNYVGKPGEEVFGKVGTAEILFPDAIVNEFQYQTLEGMMVTIIRLGIPVYMEFDRREIDTLRQGRSEGQAWNDLCVYYIKMTGDEALNKAGFYIGRKEGAQLVNSYLDAFGTITVGVKLYGDVLLASIADYVEEASNGNKSELYVSVVDFSPDDTIGNYSFSEEETLPPSPRIAEIKLDEWTKRVLHPERGIIPLPTGPVYESFTPQQKQETIGIILETYHYHLAELESRLATLHMRTIDDLVAHIDYQGGKMTQKRQDQNPELALPGKLAEFFHDDEEYMTFTPSEKQKILNDIVRILALEKVSAVIMGADNTGPPPGYPRIDVQVSYGDKMNKHPVRTVEAYIITTMDEYKIHTVRDFYRIRDSLIMIYNPYPAMIIKQTFGNPTGKYDIGNRFKTSGVQEGRYKSKFTNRYAPIEADQSFILHTKAYYANFDQIRTQPQGTRNPLMQALLEDLIYFNVWLIEKYSDFKNFKIEELNLNAAKLLRDTKREATVYSDQWMVLLADYVARYLSTVLYSLYQKRTDRVLYQIIDTFVTKVLGPWLHNIDRDEPYVSRFNVPIWALAIAQHYGTRTRPLADEPEQKKNGIKHIQDSIQKSTEEEVVAALPSLYIDSYMGPTMKLIFEDTIGYLSSLFDQDKDHEEKPKENIEYTLYFTCKLMVGKVHKYFYTFNPMNDPNIANNYLVKGGAELMSQKLGERESLLGMNYYDITEENITQGRIMCDLAMVVDNYSLLESGKITEKLKKFHKNWVIALTYMYFKRLNTATSENQVNVKGLKMESTQFVAISYGPSFERYVMHSKDGESLLERIVDIFSGYYPTTMSKKELSLVSERLGPPQNHVPQISWLMCDYLCTMVLMQTLSTKKKKLLEKMREKSIGEYVSNFDDVKINKWLIIIIDRFSKGLYNYIKKKDIGPLTQREITEYVESVTIRVAERLNASTTQRANKPIYDFSVDHVLSHYILKRLIRDIHNKTVKVEDLPQYQKLFGILLDNTNQLSIGIEQVREIMAIIVKQDSAISKGLTTAETQVGIKAIQDSKYLKAADATFLKHCDVIKAKEIAGGTNIEQATTVQTLGVEGITTIRKQTYSIKVQHMYNGYSFEFSGHEKGAITTVASRTIKGDRIYYPSLLSQKRF